MNSEKQALVPRLRFPEFRDAGEWEAQKIGHHLTESRVKGSKGDVAKKLTVKLWGNGVYEKSEAVQGSANTQYYRRIAGQFIYSKLDFLNQAFGIIPDHLDNYESTVDLPCFDASDELDVRFLLEYVQRESFYKKYGEIADGGRKAKRIQVETFLDFPLFLPTLREQQKIADCLSSLDALIAAQADKIDALKTHKKGLMQQLFPREGETVPRLRFPEFWDAGEWGRTQLSTQVELISGLHLSPTEYSDSGEIPYFTGPSDYSNELSTVRKWTARSENVGRSDDTLITVKGNGVGELLRLKLDEVAMGRQLMAVRPSIAHGGFIFFFLEAQRQRLIALASGNLIPGLSRGDILSLEILVPEKQEQMKVANCLSALDALITAATGNLDALKTHKKGLMQQLFPCQEAVGV